MSGKLMNIAIVGATGRVGGYIASALLQRNANIPGNEQQTITALTRKGNTKPLPPGLKVVEVDYSSQDSLTTALRGQDFLIITLSARAPNDLHSEVCKAAGVAGVRYIMPNLFTSYDPANAGLNETMIGKGALTRIQDVKNAGVACVPMVCGFWYEWSLAMGEQWFGFDVANRKVTLFDDGKSVICTSTWEACGNAAAALLALPEKGTSPCVEDWKDKPLYFASFRVSQRDMLDSLHRVLGDKDEDWGIKYEGANKRIADGAEEMKSGNQLGFAKIMYSRILHPSGDGDFARDHTLANEVLGLPEESLDEATARVVNMVTEGWNNKIE